MVIYGNVWSFFYFEIKSEHTQPYIDTPHNTPHNASHDDIMI